MALQIVIARDAQKVLARMQPAKARDIRRAIAGVAADPSARNPNLRPLRGVRNGFRIRVGDWRVSYTLDHTAGILDVYEIAPRGGHIDELVEIPLLGGAGRQRSRASY